MGNCIQRVSVLQFINCYNTTMTFQDIKNLYHYGTAVIANAMYGNPSRKLKVIGVTGTDGKTTTTSLIYHILKTAGKKVSMVSTVYAQIGGKVYDTGFHVTTPSPFAVQNYLKLAVDHGDELFVLETTSHSLDQHRVGGVEFAIGVITNVTHEHLDYHKTYENYVRTKSILLQQAAYPLANVDDQSYELIKECVGDKLVTYGLQHKADFQFDISENLGIELAEFNKYNYLAAYAVCKQCGLSDEEIFTAMKTYVLPPGRLEVIYKNDITVIVDFAHTPHSLHVALDAIRKQHIKGNGRLIHAFSCAAKRDEAKRPIMGEESATYADLTILTEEDYRDEDPVKINNEIAAGMLKKGWKEVLPDQFATESQCFAIIVDRQEAVKKAIEIAQPGDVIVFTGKGHEQSLCRGNKEYPWNDKESLLTELKKKSR